MRHEARREEFREEVRRTGSAANVLPPPVPVYRTESRLSGADVGGAAREARHESHFHRSSSSSRNEFRGGYTNGGTGQPIFFLSLTVNYLKNFQTTFCDQLRSWEAAVLRSSVAPATCQSDVPN